MLICNRLQVWYYHNSSHLTSSMRYSLSDVTILLKGESICLKSLLPCKNTYLLLYINHRRIFIGSIQRYIEYIYIQRLRDLSKIYSILLTSFILPQTEAVSSYLVISRNTNNSWRLKLWQGNSHLITHFFLRWTERAK